jgi:hypothetical protein
MNEVYIAALIRLALAGMMFAIANAAGTLFERHIMSKTKKAVPTKRDDRRAKVAAKRRTEKRARLK